MIGSTCRCFGFDVRRARGETAGVDRIEDMRRRARRGEPVASIARAVGVSEPTVRKYARMGDLSPERPARTAPVSKLLASYEATIDA